MKRKGKIDNQSLAKFGIDFSIKEENNENEH